MTTAARKPDRRVQRTRQLLRDALIALIVERGFDALTVQDITDRANVGRATFYLHYRDKDELLFASMKEVYDDLAAAVDVPAMQHYMAQGMSPSYVAFKHVVEHRDFYRLMLGRHGVASFSADVRAYLTQQGIEMFRALMPPDSEPRLPLNAVAAYLAGAELALMAWWLEQGETYTPEDIARMFFQLGVYGALWALRMPVPPPPEGG